MEILGGPIFGAAGAGESHGPAITTIVFGCPAGLEIDRQEIQDFLDRRRPGGNKHGTPRNEKDKVLLLSGIYQDDHDALTNGPAISATVDEASFESVAYETGFSTGEPIAAVVLSTSRKSAHYEQFTGETGQVRPGHTDLVKYHKSRGFIDVRGGGRSSYRSSISDVIAGSIARIFLREKFGTVFLSSISQVGSLKTNKSLSARLEKLAQSGSLNVAAITELQQSLHAAEIHSLDADFASEAGELIKQTRMKGDSIGAKVEVVGVHVPALIGDPMYNSLKVTLMGMLGGLNAVQSCEIGDGEDVVARSGSENNDPIRKHGYVANSHGGLIGGVTTGKPLVARVGFKPTSTIHHKQQSIQKNFEEIDFELEKGRHDPCVGVRAGVTLESRMAIAVMNATLVHQSQSVDRTAFELFDGE